MKTILNLTRVPLKIQLHGGKVLHLGPGKTGQVSDQTVERPSFQKLVEEGSVEVQGEGGTAADDAGPSQALHESTHGHQPTTVVHPKGNR